MTGVHQTVKLLGTKRWPEFLHILVEAFVGGSTARSIGHCHVFIVDIGGVDGSMREVGTQVFETRAGLVRRVSGERVQLLSDTAGWSERRRNCRTRKSR